MKQKIFKNRKITARVACLVFLIMCSNKWMYAQNPVLVECMNINKAYRASSYLSFDVKYRYADEATPTTYEDSSLATYKIHGYKYWGSVDSVEFMQNDSFQVAVYIPEKTMTVGLPSYNFDETIPLAQWDSLFIKDNQFTYSFGVDGGYKKITVNYDVEVSPVQQFEMWYDSVSFRINHIRYKVDNGATEESFKGTGTMSGEVVVVDILFSNYQTGQFTNSVFNSGIYFIKEGNDYTPVNPWSDFEVFVTSPGLKAP